MHNSRPIQQTKPSTLDSGTSSLHDVHHLVECRLRGVAPSRLEQRAMSGPEIDDFLGAQAGKTPVGDAAGEAVTSTDAVFDLEILEWPRFVELTVEPKHATPVVDQAALNLAQGSANGF